MLERADRNYYSTTTTYYEQWHQWGGNHESPALSSLLEGLRRLKIDPRESGIMFEFGCNACACVRPVRP